MENSSINTILGLLFLRQNRNPEAFQSLGNSLAIDPKNSKTLIAVGSIMLDMGDCDGAWIKFKISAFQDQNSPHLWNNLGMCLFAKKKFIAAISCLKRALYLDPFEWIISFNLGLVHMNLQQYATAFQFFSQSLNLKPNYYLSYMYIGIVLDKLGDFQNSCNAFEKAMRIEGLVF